MKKLYFFLLSVLLYDGVSAQVAVGGTSENYDKVYWLTWDSNVKTYFDFPDSRDGSWNGELQERTYVWDYAEDIRIIADVTELLSTNGKVLGYTPGTWEGDGLGELYSGPEGERFHGDGKVSIMGVEHSALVNENPGAKVNFSIDIRLEFKIEGQWMNVPYPGMVIADAEELNGSNEYISAKITNSGSETEWQLIDKRENGDSENYKITFSTEEGLQQFRLQATNGKIGNQAVFFARGATGLQDVEMKGGGKTALALGFILPFDVSTAKEYCQVRHYLDDFAPVENNIEGCQNLSCMVETPLNPIPTAFIGPSEAPLDKTSIRTEDLEVNFTQTEIAIDILVNNTKSEPATVYWWMDFNNDGHYGIDEVQTFEIAPNVTDQYVTLIFERGDGPDDYDIKNLTAGDLHSRLRITTTVLDDAPGSPEDERSCALAADGEVEDYIFNVRGISISGNVFIDADGLEDGEVDNEFSGELLNFSEQYEEPLFAYLMRATDNSIAGITQIEADGMYTITNMNHGSYVLALSRHTYELEETFPLNASNHLHETWWAVGETLGVHVGEGPEGENQPDNPIDAQVPIETPDAGWDIRDVNFGLDQPPLVADIAVVSQAYQRVEVPVLDDAQDRQGNESIVKETLRLLDAGGDPVTTFTTAEGTFEITEDFVIAFKPVNSFYGKSVSVPYQVEDLAGLVSRPGLLEIEVLPPRKILTNPAIPSKAY